MMRLGMRSVGIAAAALAAAAPALAQNGSGTALPPSTGAPPPNAAPAPTAAPPPSTAPAVPVTVQPVEPVTVTNQPAPQAPPPQAPISISPDAAYPNGFADPADRFANDVRADNDRGGGFDWGLLGLLGLLGLIPLIRGNPKTIYVERDDQARRVVRRGEGDGS